MIKIVKYVGLFILIIFSFFYTDKVASVITEADSLMVELKSVSKSYSFGFVDGVINGDTIIPGINGRKMNIDKSYKKMREYGIFNEKLIVYDQVKPSISISDNLDKFIISGNDRKKMVSIIFILDNDVYFDRLESILNNKGGVYNYFVDASFLINNSNSILSLKNREIYNYGNGGIYSFDNLIFVNNLISRITKKDAIYCLVKNKDNSTIDLCSDNGLYTVLPNIIVKSNLYGTIKDSVSNGSIILMDVSNNTVMELGIVIDYIRGKGLDIVGLSDLLNEKV